MALDITHGMNVEAVRQLGTQLQSNSAGLVRTTAGDIDRLVNETARLWLGPDADSFRHWWLGKRPKLSAIADDLHEFGETALRNAKAQDLASGCTTGRAASAVATAGPHVESYEALEIDTDWGVLIVGQGSNTVVTTEKLSDGTYRLVIESTFDSSLGISVSDIVGDLGDFDIGLTTEASNGFVIEIDAATEADAKAVQDALKGRAADMTNRFTGGGVDRSEIFGQDMFNREGVSLSSVTTKHVAAGVAAEAQAVVVGFDTQLEAGSETSRNADGTISHRTVVDGGVDGTGWNQDGVHQSLSYEVIEREGEPVGFRITRSEANVSDTRGGGEKVRDYLPFIDNSESSIRTVTNTYDYSMADIASVEGASEALTSGDRAGLMNLMDDNRDLAVNERTVFDAEADSSGRGGRIMSVGYTSSTGYGSGRLIEHSVSGT